MVRWGLQGDLCNALTKQELSVAQLFIVHLFTKGPLCSVTDLYSGPRTTTLYCAEFPGVTLVHF